MGDIEDIKKIVKDKKIIIGTDRVIKNLRLGKIEKAYISSNCSNDAKKELNQIGKMAGAKIIQLKIPNEELGAVCKKPFSISVLGVAK